MAALNKRLQRLATVIWGDYQTNDLWQRIVKCSLACTVAVIIVITPKAVSVFGPSTFLAPMATVFAHPGQRMGTMIESLLMVLLGSLLGLAWSLFGLFLSSLVFDHNEPAAYAIRAMFLLVAVLVHGYVRSSSPRIFLFVAFLLIASIIVLLGGAHEVTLSVFTNVYYPLLAGGGVVVVVNASMFPELSSSFLGLSAIDTLCETMDTLTRATHWFVTPGGDSQEELAQVGLTMTTTAKSSPEKPKRKKGRFRKFLDGFPNPFQPSQGRYRASTVPVGLTTVASLTGKKAKLRTRLARCKAAQREVNYELSISALPPSSMKPLSTSHMSKLVQNTITVIGACENKFIVLENDARSEDDDLTATDSFVSDASGIKRMSTFDDYLRRVENAKPIREIEASSASLLESILERIREPVQEFEASLKEAVRLVIVCLAYCYDVPRLPSGAPAPKGIHLQELDFRIDVFTEALANFDASCAMELRRSALDETGHSIDFMPRMETFLISSFVLAFRQSAMQVLEMLNHVRKVVEQRKARNDRSSIWFPKHTNIRQWLTTGGEIDGLVLPETGRKEVRRGKAPPGSKPKAHVHQKINEKIPKLNAKDEEKGAEFTEPERLAEQKTEVKKTQDESDSRSKNSSRILKLRGKAADTIEWVRDSDDISYALKLALAVLSLSWPAFVASWNDWYSAIRGIWAPMQLILVFEVAIGTSFFIFFIRLIGVIFGCVLGYLSYEIGRGNPIAMVFILVLGIVPSFYIQLGTKYVKAGMVSTVTMVVVALAAMNGSGSAYENFYKRLSAFVIGGAVALLVEMLLFPVRARDRLLESLSASVKQVQNMQAAMAVGLDSPIKPDFRNPGLHKRFNHARTKARGALAAAETFLPFCTTEPRLKGSFRPLEPIYKEILYVLHQIIDRMDNMVQLRKEYGSSILEDLNPRVHAYRRNVAASIMLVLFSVNEALTSWQPLPQFIPSSRLAQLRLVNHVREVLAAQSGTQTPAGGAPTVFDENVELAEQVAHLITQKRFLSWNASTAGQMEIIEYLEELVELVKLLVGVNAFRSGLLEKPEYSNYRSRTHMDRVPLASVPTVQSSTAGIPAEEVSTAPAAFSDDGSRATGLQRTQTIRGRAEHIRERLRKKRGMENAVDSDSEEDIPMSLQRVGTRLCENDAVVRRRAFTLSHDNR
ncbi:Lactobacillus histidine kinase [Fusarium albosuccineum]|uniref:Lactobacillus histidine kinase n=1 Tax=Fusarium albosuccineum TaxID=1237068 RepID=A0A8H4L9V7_9HYPO|nr:Lactobacillus histidine kinase [Fusarium albosuccineum]